MKVLIPLDIDDCVGDCPFVDFDDINDRWICGFEFHGGEVPRHNAADVPSWCPIRKFQERK
jgi:hypothetical protein